MFSCFRCGNELSFGGALSDDILVFCFVEDGASSNLNVYSCDGFLVGAVAGVVAIDKSCQDSAVLGGSLGNIALIIVAVFSYFRDGTLGKVMAWLFSPVVDSVVCCVHEVSVYILDCLW